MNLKDELSQAKEAGRVPNDTITWHEAYQSHLDTVEEPLPFSVFKDKMENLNTMLRLDPDGKVREYDSKIYDLSKELGV